MDHESDKLRRRTAVQIVQNAMMQRLYPGVNLPSPPIIHVEMEAYIKGCTVETIKDIIKGLGLVVPHYVGAMAYFRNSIHACIPLFLPPTVGSIKHMTDVDILRKVDAFIVYHSRGYLIDMASCLLNGGTGFFIPYTRRGVNTTTFDGTPITDTLFTISYGTLESYVCYTLEELNAGFEPYGVDNNEYACRILNIDGSWRVMPWTEARYLLDLLLVMHDTLLSNSGTADMVGVIIRSISILIEVI